MFGGTFGAFETQGCHFFNPNHPTYLRIAAIARVRNRRDLIGLALRRGRQYRRETAGSGSQFSFRDEVVAWSRLYRQQEVLVALNTHGGQAREAEVTVDATLNPCGSSMSVLYRSDWTESQLRGPCPVPPVAVQRGSDDRATVRIDLPAAGMMILASGSASAILDAAGPIRDKIVTANA
jgi:hypothetical protein